MIITTNVEFGFEHSSESTYSKPKILWFAYIFIKLHCFEVCVTVASKSADSSSLQSSSELLHHCDHG